MNNIVFKILIRLVIVFAIPTLINSCSELEDYSMIKNNEFDISNEVLALDTFHSVLFDLKDHENQLLLWD